MTYQHILDRLNHAISVRYKKPYGFARRLAPLLNVSQDTIYNKLNGRTRLTVEELSIIIRELKIPLNEVMQENPTIEIHPLELHVYAQKHLDGFSGVYEWYHQTLTTVSGAENSRILQLCSNISEISFVDMKYMSAFSQQKWLFYNAGLETVPPISQILDDSTHQKNRSGFLESLKHIKAAEYILSIDITRNYVLDLIMFYEYNLITKDEAANILEDLHNLLLTFERLCNEGITPDSEQVINMYYHSTQLYGNNIQLIESDHLNLGIIYSHYGNPIVAHHSDTFDQLKSWYRTWKRSSIPITLAGIKNRLHFINEQKKAFDYAKGILGM